MAIEIVDFPSKNGGSFHSYIKLPEGRIQENQESYQDTVFGFDLDFHVR